MANENAIQTKSYAFAIRVVKLYKLLVEERNDRVLSKQLLRSGTAVGALIEEAIGGESDADFKHKLKIAYKECRETNYWLRLLKDPNYITEKEFESINQDCEELLKMLTSILKTITAKVSGNAINC